MTLNAAMKVLEKDAEFCGMEFNQYLGYVGMHRGAFPQGVLAAFDTYAEHKLEQTKAELGLDIIDDEYKQLECN